MDLEEAKDMRDTAFWGMALAVKAVLDESERAGYCSDDVLWLAQVWRDQDPYVHASDCAVAINARRECSCKPNPSLQGIPNGDERQV